MGWVTGYAHRKQIDIDNTNVDSILSNFPICVQVAADAALASCQADGDDIRFTQSDESTEIKFEEEGWAGGASSNVTANWWVKVPSISAVAATEIFLYYENAGASNGEDEDNVWDANYFGVYHLNEAWNVDVDGYKDSSGAGHHGQLTDADSDSASVAGMVDKAIDFNGDADFIAVADHADHDSGTSGLTVESWVESDGAALNKYYLVHDDSSYKYLLNNGSWGSAFQFYVRTASGTTASGSHDMGGANEWRYAVGRYDRSDAAGRVQIWVDDQERAAAAGHDEDISAGDEGLSIGKWGAGFWNGILDEVRLSNIARADEWLKFGFYNIKEADNELSWGAEESPPTVGFTPKVIWIS